MSEFGTELRRRRQERGWSLAALAAATHFTKGYLSKIENGRLRANPELARSCDRVLDAGGELAALVERPAPAPRGLSGLTADTRHFVGRATELAELAEVLTGGRDRVCVVSGLAGVGKTALVVRAANRAAARFPDGCLFLDLRGHSAAGSALPPGEAANRLLRLLDIPGDRVPRDLDGRAALLRGVLRDRRVLLVLDNARSAAQVGPLLPDGAGCRVLVTSRERMPALDDARHLAVGMVDSESAATLLRAVAGDRAPSDETVLSDILSHCGGLPMAVRIVAARLAAGGWSADRLRDRLARESTTLSALDDGERSVAAAFLVSYRELVPAARTLLGLLALHPPTPITTVAAESLLGVTEGGADSALDRLHDAHLVTRDDRGDIEMHDLVRAFADRYARPELDTAARAAATSRLVDHALGTLVYADELLEPYRFRPPMNTPAPHSVPFGDAEGALAWLRARWPTLVGITELAAGDARCWQLAFVLRAFFFRDKLFEPYIATYQTALATADSIEDAAAVGMIWNSLGMAHVELGHLADAADCHSRARVAYAAAGDHRGEVDARSSLAWVRLYQGQPEVTAQELTVVLGVYQRAGRVRNAVIAQRGIALALTALDRFGEAREYARAAQEGAQLPVESVMCLNCLAWVSFRAGEWEDARRYYTEAADLAALASVPYERARALVGLGNTAAGRGEHRAAVELWSLSDAEGVTLNPVVLGEAWARVALARELFPAEA
ncbi:XRE family transcriptional regulator [Actinokineospora enzanensis]|uniref:XRE family transcriptional regulator n=1 Tax=Actinokineospora enzanensis TaxID=155975 RepID=UPI00037AA367|nr:XRE family transcriptional regulator [Actinokineospora enzanensis]